MSDVKVERKNFLAFKLRGKKKTNLVGILTHKFQKLNKFLKKFLNCRFVKKIKFKVLREALIFNLVYLHDFSPNRAEIFPRQKANRHTQSPRTFHISTFISPRAESKERVTDSTRLIQLNNSFWNIYFELINVESECLRVKLFRRPKAHNSPFFGWYNSINKVTVGGGEHHTFWLRRKLNEQQHVVDGRGCAREDMRRQKKETRLDDKALTRNTITQFSW